MRTRKENNLIENPYLGIIAVILFFIWVMVTEYGPLFLNKGTGAFIWTTFHFIINPILGVIICILLICHVLLQKQLQPKIMSTLAMLFPILVIYVGFSGNIWFVEMLGINFQ